MSLDLALALSLCALAVLAGCGAIALFCIGVVAMALVLCAVVTGLTFGAALIRRRADG